MTTAYEPSDVARTAFIAAQNGLPLGSSGGSTSAAPIATAMGAGPGHTEGNTASGLTGPTQASLHLAVAGSTTAPALSAGGRDGVSSSTPNVGPDAHAHAHGNGTRITRQDSRRSGTGTVPSGHNAVSPTGVDRRYSVAALWSIAAENDQDVDDELTQAQRKLRELKARISGQSKKNFLLERDVRYLDSRIALLIQNRMALDEQAEVATHLEEMEGGGEGTFPDDRKRQIYGNLFFLLQSEPRHIGTLTRLVSLSEIDTLLQTVMFTIYGNQYESREEYLLLSMFQNVLAAQFELSTEFGSLLRANTPVSRMMTTYTRRGPGQTYLKNVLSERINNLLEHQDLDLEINPLKVYEQMIVDIELETGAPCQLPRGITQEQASAHADVQAIIGPRLTTLMEIAGNFLSTIIASLDQVPYGIRWICKQIRSLTKRKYPNANDANICSLIGGFFMLRFVNPAIVTPQAYMLVEGNPSRNPRRALTLVAKMLQNLANKSTFSKEPYMAALNVFVETNKDRINTFLNDLCEVGDFYEALEMDQYVALSKKEIQLNISLNEIYSTHSLLLQHMDVLAPSDKHHLKICLNDLGPAPAQVPRHENKTINLALFSRWETPITDVPSAIADSQLTQADILYMDTKALFVQILRTMPSLANTSTNGREPQSLQLTAIAEAAATARDPSVVKRGLKLRGMLAQMSAMQAQVREQARERAAALTAQSSSGLAAVSDGADGVDAAELVEPAPAVGILVGSVLSEAEQDRLMVEEVTQELVHLGNLRTKVNQEIASLEQVFKAILDHNNYLRSQLESYKEYLQNVRIQSGLVTSKSGARGRGQQAQGPYKFSHAALEKEGIVVESNVPENRRKDIYFTITSPMPGTFVISLNFKRREKPILEMDLKLDDLLEKQQMGAANLDLEYVQLSVVKVLALLNKTFLIKGKA